MSSYHLVDTFFASTQSIESLTCEETEFTDAALSRQIGRHSVGSVIPRAILYYNVVLDPDFILVYLYPVVDDDGCDVFMFNVQSQCLSLPI